jgi:hypothetical protein
MQEMNQERSTSEEMLKMPSIASSAANEFIVARVKEA